MAEIRFDRLVRGDIVLPDRVVEQGWIGLPVHPRHVLRQVIEPGGAGNGVDVIPA